MKLHFYVFCFFLCFCVNGYQAEGQAEESDKITLEFKRQPFEAFVEEVESKTGFRFYYNSQQIDSVEVNTNLYSRNLKEVLDQVERETGLQFSIDVQRKNVYVTKDRKIITDLPEGFFDKGVENIPEKEAQIIVDHFVESQDLQLAKAKRRYEIGQRTTIIKPGKARLTGQVRNAKTGEPIFGASVFIENPFVGASTDALGNYLLIIPKGSHTLKVTSVGMVEEEQDIVFYSEGKHDIEILESVISLKEVEVRSRRDINVISSQMGVEKLSIQSIKQVPTIMGEVDVLRVVLTLPGVKTVGEASTGFNVRGGSVDQNLILFNNATIFNPSHLFGFFSAFNPDAVAGLELFKSSIPAKFGGRLASVLEVSPRYGNKKKFEGAAGIGLLTGRLSVEGPIIKDKTSFLLGGRSTYSNWLLKLLDNEAFKNSKASFNDVNLNLNHEISEKSNLYFTAYNSNDQFKLKSDTLFNYTTQAASLKWRRIFNNKLTGEVAGSYSRYQYRISSEQNPVNAFKLSFAIDQANIQGDFIYSLNSRHTLNFGLSSVYYKLRPGSFLPLGGESAVIPNVMDTERALESALYLEDLFEITSKLVFNVGLRYSLYNFLGPGNVLAYENGQPKENYTVTDTTYYRSGEIINAYHGPEYRLSARYKFTDNFSAKVGYNTLRQYIHMLSNATAVSPTDVWKLSDPNIRPQFGRQISLGLYKNFKSGLIESSIEGYFKDIDNFLDYKGGAKLILNDAIETDVLSTEGEAYGVEFMVKKLSGKLNGWLSYTYSRTLLRMNEPDVGEVVNRGKWYPTNYDKPHDFTLIGNYKFSHRFSISFNCTYSTGRPITLPIAKYSYGGAERVFYSERNAYRIPDYFRTDFSMNIYGNHKVHQRTHNSWTIGVYNLTGRRNAYSTYFVSESGAVKGYKLSIFGVPIPFVNYNIRF